MKQAAKKAVTPSQRDSLIGAYAQFIPIGIISIGSLFLFYAARDVYEHGKKWLLENDA